MKKCASPDHPFCTQWVTPGDTVCAAQHLQPLAIPAAATDNTALTAAWATLTATAATATTPLTTTTPSLPAAGLPASTVTTTTPLAAPAPPADHARSSTAPGTSGPSAREPARPRLDTALPHLHFSGFDPRAAGGRQTLKVELLGMVAEMGTQLELSLRCELLPEGRAEHIFVRTTRGHWRPVLLEFSSKNREHGQYRMDIEVKYLFGGKISRKWVCTPVLLVPRIDASLADIHQIFLARHKNVKVMVDDASIAKISGYQNADNLDISSKNASIAHLDFNPPKGKIDVGFTSIAWDEDLLEIDVSQPQGDHPQPCNLACLSNAALNPQQIHLFALEQTILGRYELLDPLADILLAHYRGALPDENGLTRRISARHALIRHVDNHFEIEDISRYGLLIDGKWPGKEKPCTLKPGMKIELTASFKHIVTLQVLALAPQALVLQRLEPEAHGEMFFVLAPEQAMPHTLPHWPASLPRLYHLHGGFWHFDPETHKTTALTAAIGMSSLHGASVLQGLAGNYQFVSHAYPEQRALADSATA